MLLNELSKVSIQSLRVFAYVSLLGSLTEAASALGLSQPAISLQISNLETLLSFKLFEKQGRKNVLTVEGKSFLDLILPQLEKLDQILVDAKAKEKLVLPRLYVGSMQGVGEHWLIDRLLEFKTKVKNLRIHFEVGEEGHLRELLSTGRLNLVITPAKFEHPRIISQKFMQEYFVPVGNQANIKALADTLEGAEDKKKFWNEVSWVGYGDNSFSDPWVGRWLEQNGLLVNKRFDFHHVMNSYSAIKKVLIDGLGVCVLPKHVCEDEIKSGKLSCLETKRFKALENNLYISHREKSLNATQKEFLDYLVK